METAATSGQYETNERLKQATLQGTTRDKISGKALDGMEWDGYRVSSLLCRRGKGAFRDGEE